MIDDQRTQRDLGSTPRGRPSIRGQHKAPAHSDPSSRYGKRHEKIVAYTFPGRHPIYEPAVCPDCGAAIRWLPLGANGNLVPRCENERCIAMPEQKTEPTNREIPDVIRKKQWKKFAKRGG